MLDDGDCEILIFGVGARHYGLPLAHVREIVRAAAFTPLPKAPAIIEGVVDLRGRIVPLLDIRTRFGLPAKPVEPSDHLVIAQAGERIVAIRADRAAGLARIPTREIFAAEEVSPAVNYVAGIAALADGVLVIHDLKTFLSRAESQSLDEALSAETPA